MRYYILTILTFFMVISVKSQKIPTITYDEKTRSFDSVIPVYQEVNLRFKDYDRIVGILLVEHCPRQTLDSTLLRLETCEAGRVLNEIPTEDFWNEIVEDENYLYIRLRQSDDGEVDTFLRPMKNYSLLFLQSSAELPSLRRNYAKSFIELNFKQMNELKKQYEKYEDGLGSLEILFSEFPEDFFNRIEMPLSNNSTREKVKSKLYERECLTKEIETNIISNVDEIFNKDNYRDLKKFLFTIDSVKAKNLGINLKDANELILWLSSLNSKKSKKFLLGEMSISELKSTRTALEENIRNIDFLRKLFFHEQVLNNRKAQNILEPVLRNIQSKMISNLEILNKIEKIDSEIEDNLIPNSNYKTRDKDYSFGKNPIITSTNINSFERRIQLRFTPDVGLVNFGFQNGFNEVSPYLGFHFNLSFLDKDLPFNKLRNKTVLDYLSLNLAWALNSIEKNGKREGLIDNGSLLVGMGFRIDHTFRIVAGSNFFYKLDESPISNNRKLAVAPYAGISVDFQVQELLNGFSNIFKNE